MSTATPGLQRRSQYGNYWGVYATALVLPNASGAALAAPQFKLEQGDIAYVVGVGLYQCDSAGTAGVGNAAWSQIGFAATTQDRFAPTYLVGNTAAGDSATPYIGVNGFSYYPDIGDGAQLQLALTACSSSPNGGVVYVRRGNYNLDLAGSPAAPLTVGSNTIVQGEGSNSTIVTGRASGNQGVFSVSGNAASLRDLAAVVDTADPGSIGSDAVILFASDGDITNVNVSFETAVGGVLREGIRIDATSLSGQTVPLTNVLIDTPTSTGGASPTICLRTINTNCLVDVRNLRASGLADVGVSLGTNAVLTDARITNWSVRGLDTSGAVALRLIASQIEALSAAAPGAIGALIQNTGSVEISGCSIRTTGLGHTAALRVADNGIVLSNVTIRGLITSGFETGMQLGDTSVGSSVSEAFITECNVESQSSGILVAAQSVSVQVKNNRVSVTPTSGAALYGIRYESGGSRAQCDGNDVSVTDILSGAYGIRMQCPGTVRGNRVLQDGCLWGIEVDGAAVQCTDNDVINGPIGVNGSAGAIHLANQTLIRATGNYALFLQTPYTNPAILVEGTLAQVSMNTTVVTAGVSSPGITLAATTANCNVIGNICQGSTSVPTVVDDTLGGTSNNLSNNIAA